MNFLYYFFITLLYPLVRILLPATVLGRENLPKEGGVLMCVNHTNWSDAALPVFYLGYRHQLHVMAKAVVLKVPIIGVVLMAMGVFPVNRGETDIASVRTTMKHLKAGKWVLLFPEGKRVNPDESVAAKTGAVRIASKVKAQILPVWISPGRKLCKHSKIIIGKPYIPEQALDRNYDLAAQELMQHIFSLEPKK